MHNLFHSIIPLDSFEQRFTSCTLGISSNFQSFLQIFNILGFGPKHIFFGGCCGSLVERRALPKLVYFILYIP